MPWLMFCSAASSTRWLKRRSAEASPTMVATVSSSEPASRRAASRSSRADADRFREEMRQKAHEDAGAIVKNAEKEIQLETQRAVAQIRTEAVDLSLAIASKLLRRNVSASDNEALIQEALGQFKQVQ